MVSSPTPRSRAGLVPRIAGGAALVSTVALSRSGGATARVIRICGLLAADGDDMVVKALSWALRELTKTDARAVKRFLATHAIAARVRREVTNKLVTRRKSIAVKAGP